ncbi:MAG TPA: ribonuclease III [Acidimicrobiia bacterium]|nr:ribonuclease III [Acidimicrobiia bacterium]
MGDPTALEASLGHRFTDPLLLHRALVHRSYSAEVEGEEPNERLEFLGDAVLGLIVADALYDGWNLPEGQMAKVRAAVVNETSLAAVATAIGLGSELLLGRGEEATGGRTKPSILADAMEAVLGAVYLDAGLDAALRVVLEHWGDLITERAAAPGRRDYKTRLQEILATRGLVPSYEVEGSGPDHARLFEATVRADGDVIGRGSGTSKKRAEQEAAEEALAALDDA